MAQALQKSAGGAAVIPDRLYFKIGDVARICGVETYVLRFWETQFPQLKPNKSGTGQRLYRRREVEMALEIKRLVHAEGYTLAGAKQALDNGHKRGTAMPVQAPGGPKVQTVVQASVTPAASAGTSQAVVATIGRARVELRELLTILSNQEAMVDARAPRPRARLLRVRQESEPLFPL